MPATAEEVKKIILEEFPGSDVSEVAEEDHRVVGTFRWDGFKGKDVPERTRLVTQKVRGRLGIDGVNVGILFPLTPDEHF